MKNYYVHDFICGNPILVDRVNETLVFYNKNIYGQLHNLNNPTIYHVSKKLRNGLIKRSNSSSYSLRTAKLIDRYVYTYLLSSTEQVQCGAIQNLGKTDTLISETDNYTQAITEMCKWVFQTGYCWNDEPDETERNRLLAYCIKYLENEKNI